MKRSIRRLWKDHRKIVLAAAVMAWVLLITLLYHALAAEPLKVAGLPVT